MSQWCICFIFRCPPTFYCEDADTAGCLTPSSNKGTGLLEEWLVRGRGREMHKIHQEERSSHNGTAVTTEGPHHDRGEPEGRAPRGGGARAMWACKHRVLACAPKCNTLKSVTESRSGRREDSLPWNAHDSHLACGGGGPQPPTP